MRLYKISTPQSDEYKEAYFVVCDDVILYSSKKFLYKSYIGQSWNSTKLSFISVWKLYSSKLKDNIYPSIEEL